MSDSSSVSSLDSQDSRYLLQRSGSEITSVIFNRVEVRPGDAIELRMDKVENSPYRYGIVTGFRRLVQGTATKRNLVIEYHALVPFEKAQDHPIKEIPVGSLTFCSIQKDTLCLLQVEVYGAMSRADRYACKTGWLMPPEARAVADTAKDLHLVFVPKEKLAAPGELFKRKFLVLKTEAEARTSRQRRVTEWREQFRSLEQPYQFEWVETHHEHYCVAFAFDKDSNVDLTSDVSWKNLICYSQPYDRNSRRRQSMAGVCATPPKRVRMK